VKRIVLRCRRLLAAILIPLTAVLVALSPTAAPASPHAAQASPIQHVVVIYLENHTFDNLLGFWCARHQSRCRDAGGNYVGMPATITLSDGAVVTPSVTPGKVPNVDHSVASQQAAMDCTASGCGMDGWQNILHGSCAAPAYACISGYQPWQEPNLTTLAEYFAISDATFSMRQSPSWGGHLYAVAATTDGFTGDNPPLSKPGGLQGWGCDSDKLANWSPGAGQPLQRHPSCVPDYALSLPNGGAFEPTPALNVPTIMDRLTAAGLSWRIYGATCASEKVGGNGLETCGSAPTGYQWNPCASFAECLYGQQASNASDTQFLTDAQNGTLPAFSLVTPGNALDSEHNGFSMTTGDNWLGQLVGAVMNGPDWGSTAVFITYDDCGCFYDQVAPPANLNTDGQQAGPRVPLVIVSPYARPGYTDTKGTTFAGILAYTEHTFGLAPLGVNDAQAYDFSNAFNYSQPPLKRVPVVHRPLPASARRIRVTPALANDPT
jgi:phospholipase C